MHTSADACPESVASPQSIQHQCACPAMDRPIVILVVGMAGTGKTTLVHRLQHYAREQHKRAYFVNLDPAAVDVPYTVNIDIRDTVCYRDVMQNYSLGPNGAILTSLNLFATKMQQVVALLEAKGNTLDWVIVDTPGQIEVFTWSASGQLISEAFASSFTCVMLFVADSTRCAQPHTFMSSMLYASGIMLKLQLPLLVALNKTDIVCADHIQEWVCNANALELALTLSSCQGSVSLNTTYSADDTSVLLHERGRGGGGGDDDEHASSLVRSMCLFLHEFYEGIQCVAVSAASGAGFDVLDTALASLVTASSERSSALCST